MSLADFFGIVRRNLWMLIAGALLAAVPIMISVMRQPPVYTAEALIRLIDQRGAMTGALNSDVLSRNSDAILSQIEVLRGRRVIGQVVDDLGLRLSSSTVDFPIGAMRDIRVDSAATASTLRLTFSPDDFRVASGSRTVNGRYGARTEIDGVSFAIPEVPTETESAELFVRPREAAIDDVLAKLTATPRDRTDAVAISYSAADPLTAQRVTNAVVETFQYANATTAQQDSRRQRVFLQDQLAEADSVLREAEGTLSAFRSDQQFFSSREMVTAQQASLLDLEQQRALLDSERRIYGRLLTELTNGDASGQSQALQALVSSPGMAANPVVSGLYAQLTAARQQRDQLTSTGAVGETVQSLETLIRTTQQELIGAIRAHVSAVDGQIAALGDLRGQRAAQMSTLPQIEVEELRLVQNVEAIQAVTAELRANLQRAQMSEAVEVGQVQIVYEAPVPLQPAGNGLVWKVALGLIVGMLLGSGGALLRESMNTSIREPSEIEQSLGLAELAVVPHALHAENRGRMNGGEVARIGPPGRPDLAMLQGTGAIGAEAYRMLRTNLLYAQAREGLSTLVVTSPAPGEGKTTTVANLAVAFAQQGQRVLLIDCDLRRPRLHKVFGAEQAPGLTDVLTGDSPLRDVLRATQIEDLTLITAGSHTDAPAELLSSDRMDQLVKFLAEGFDLVLLDTPPVLAAAEARSLSTLVDGVVLVLRAGQTDRRDALHAVQQLTDVGADVFGAVLNDPDATMSRYGSGYKYYKYYSGAAS